MRYTKAYIIERNDGGRKAAVYLNYIETIKSN